MQVHRQTGLCDVLNQLAELLQARLRRERRLRLLGRQQPQQMPQLAERLTATCFDRQQRFGSALGIASQQRTRRAGLHDHDADAVCHHIVQLARDALTLIATGEPHVQVTFAFQLFRARAQRFGLEVALMHGAAS